VLEVAVPSETDVLGTVGVLLEGEGDFPTHDDEGLSGGETRFVEFMKSENPHPEHGVLVEFAFLRTTATRRSEG
jgi:hypothetical protein